MKKSLFLFLMVLMSSTMIFAQIEKVPAVSSEEKAPIGKRRLFDWKPQFKHKIPDGSTGVETDGKSFYITNWGNRKIEEYDTTGNLVRSFTINGVSKLRDLAFDGEYFYGSAANNQIFQMKFDTTTPILVSTITTNSVIKARHIAYVPEKDAFWVGDYSSDMSLVDKTGAVLDFITAGQHGLKGCYGSAYDTVSKGGPFLWIFEQLQGTYGLIRQIDVKNKKQTGNLCLVNNNFGAGMAGGLFLQKDVVSGTYTLGGLLQGNCIFGYDLASTGLDSLDLSMYSLGVGDVYVKAQPIDITGQVLNLGAVEITGYDLNWSINNGTVNTDNITGKNIKTINTDNFIHTVKWTPAQAGVYSLKIWVSNVNGVANDNNMSNDTIIKPITIIDKAVQRTPLYEIFTSSTCAPCNPGNAKFTQMVNANPTKEVSYIKYQQRFPSTGDPYSTDESYERLKFYKITGIPNMNIDGGWGKNANLLTQTIFDASYAKPSVLDIKLSNVQLKNKTVSVDIDIEPIADIKSNDLTLHVVIIEKKTVKNVKTNGEKEFFNVMKKMLPNQEGYSIPAFVKGTKQTFSKSYTFNGIYRLPANGQLGTIIHSIEHSVEDFNNLGFVVFVQDRVTKEVFQSKMQYVSSTSSTEELPAVLNNLRIYPNPTTNVANFAFSLKEKSEVALQIKNTLGQTVEFSKVNNYEQGEHKIELNTNSLQSGVYLVVFTINGVEFTKTFVKK